VGSGLRAANSSRATPSFRQPPKQYQPPMFYSLTSARAGFSKISR
jgi:hypothetical protein